MMGGLHDLFLLKGHKINETKEEWMLAGLLHDADYELVQDEQHGIKIRELLAQEENLKLTDATLYCIASHNYLNQANPPQSLMDWALYCGDTLTGLITATALVKPDKKLSQVEVKSVLNSYKTKKFAKSVRREDIILCQDKMGIEMSEFIDCTLKSMQDISDQLGL